MSGGDDHGHGDPPDGRAGEPSGVRRFMFLAQGRSWAGTWARAAEDAVARLTAARQARDNDGALIAAHDVLSAVDRLVGWAIALSPECDDSFRRRVEDFRTQHPGLRAARNLHEHLAGYFSEPRHRLADTHFTGEVVYRFGDDGSFVVELLSPDETAEPVELELTGVVADAFVLRWETMKAADRAMLRLGARPGSPTPDFGYGHWIEGDDGEWYFSENPPPGYDP